jgi:hypothetical protein
VKTYTILVHDRRFRRPVTLTAELAHDARAAEFAHQRLNASPDHEAIEVWRDRVKLYHLAARGAERSLRAAA